MSSKLTLSKLTLYCGSGYGLGKFFETSSLDNVDVASTLSTLLTLYNTVRQTFKMEDQNTAAATNPVPTTAQQLQELTHAVALLSASQQPSQPTVVVSPHHHNHQEAASSSALGLVGTVVLCSISTWVWCKFHNIPFTDLLYVTQKTFRSSIGQIKKRLTSLSDAIQKAKDELSKRLYALETTVTKNSKHVEKIVQKEAESIRTELHSMESRQQDMTMKLVGLSSQLQDIESQTRFSSKGIYLLCSVVSNANLTNTERSDKTIGTNHKNSLTSTNSRSNSNNSVGVTNSVNNLFESRFLTNTSGSCLENVLEEMSMEEHQKRLVQFAKENNERIFDLEETQQQEQKQNKEHKTEEKMKKEENDKSNHKNWRWRTNLFNRDHLVLPFVQFSLLQKDEQKKTTNNITNESKIVEKNQKSPNQNEEDGRKNDIVPNFFRFKRSPNKKRRRNSEQRHKIAASSP